MKWVVLEHHPNDSRINVREDGICQSLTQRMGTEGNNVPLVIQIKDEAKTSRTLDLNGGNPACNQGGMIIVEVHRRDSHP